MELTRYDFAPDISKKEYLYKKYDDFTTKTKRIPLLWKAKSNNAPTLEDILGCTKDTLKSLYLNYSVQDGKLQFDYLTYVTDTGRIFDIDLESDEEEIFQNIISNCYRGYIEMYLYRVWEVNAESEKGWHMGLEFETDGFFNSPAVFLGYHLYHYDLCRVMPAVLSYKKDSPYYDLALQAITLCNNSTEEVVEIEKVRSYNDVSTFFMGNDTVIVTENAEGEMYVIKAKYVQDIIDDWDNDCTFVPSNDARVYFASWNGKPISPYEYTSFWSLIAYLKELQK